MTASDIHVRYAGVTKTYGMGQPAIRHLDLDVRRGEFLTLLGPSGSGKTTALMMLAGFENPTSGEILLDGRRIDRVPANRRNIGLVFQNYALFPHMTVAENLAYPLKVRHFGRAEIAAKVAQMLELVQLPALAGRRPDQLSGGQQQRVAVARALIFEPNLVLMDEPLGALDKQLREQMQFEIKAIHARLGVTFVYVTHDQTEALTMSDRIAVFNAGEIQQIATPSGLYEDPATSFVAGFIGENNRLAGHVTAIGSDGNAVVKLPDGTVISARCGPGIAAGANAVVSVRPERATLVEPGWPAGPSVAGLLRHRIYVGDHLRIVVGLADGQEFILKVPNTADRASDQAPGAQVSVGWLPQDGLALAP
ncbi:ABC transporter ATP-binding protein [Aestuariivirga sp.]|uniref:ABC transporter ATP-binding protein n=1 Tax=Aestuariivirga sp. TaxID=2650926 RepID=UPI003BA93937